MNLTPIAWTVKWLLRGRLRGPAPKWSRWALLKRRVLWWWEDLWR